MASFDELKGVNPTGNRKPERPILLPSYSKKEKRFQDRTTEKDYELDNTSLTTDIEYLSTQVNLEAVHQFSSSYYSIMGGMSIDKQPTWLLPAVRLSQRDLQPSSRVPKREGYVSLVRDLAKSSGIYALASLASPLIALVLGPFLTHSLSHGEYGALAVLNTAIVLIATITQLGLGSAFFRAYQYDYESQDDRRRVLSTVLTLSLLASLPVTLIVIITAPWLADLLFHESSYSDSIKLAALVVLLQNLTVPGLSLLRAEKRSIMFAILAVANLLISLGVTLILVGILHMGIAGSLLATAGGYSVMVICTLPTILLRAGLRLRFDIAWSLLSFGLPSISSLVSVWILQLSDRYLLSFFGSLADTASYTVAYTLGGALAPVAIAPFSLAWFSIIYTIAKREDAAKTFQLIFRLYAMVLLFMTFILSLIAIVMLNILFPPSYHATASVIPVVAISTMFYGVYNVFAVGIYVQRKTWIGSILTTFAALINVGLNLVLIPGYGAMGAAASTFLAYALLTIMTYIVNQCIYPIPFEIIRFLIALSVGIVLYLGCNILAQAQNTYTACAIFICGLVIYSVCLILLAKFPIWKKFGIKFGGFIA